MAEQVSLNVNVDADVRELVKKLSGAEGVSQGELVSRLVRAYEDTPPPVEAGAVEDGESMLVLVPRDRDMLVDVITNVLARAGLHENYVLSAIGRMSIVFERMNRRERLKMR